MMFNRPLAQKEGDFILHITDLISATKKYEANGLHGSPIDAFFENWASSDQESWISVRPLEHSETSGFLHWS